MHLQARAWSYKGLEMYVGKDLQFALCALLSLSRQQRHLNQELAQRWEAMDFDSAHRLAAMAEQNAQSGNTEMAEVYYRNTVPNPDFAETPEELQEKYAALHG